VGRRRKSWRSGSSNIPKPKRKKIINNKKKNILEQLIFFLKELDDLLMTTSRWTTTDNPQPSCQEDIINNIDPHSSNPSFQIYLSTADSDGLIACYSNFSCFFPAPMASIALGCHLHPAATFSAQPSNASNQQHRHCPPQRTHAAGRRCLLRAKSSNGRPQIGASFSDGTRTCN
jgi:hypothetical protein